MAVHEKQPRRKRVIGAFCLYGFAVFDGLWSWADRGIAILSGAFKGDARNAVATFSEWYDRHPLFGADWFHNTLGVLAIVAFIAATCLLLYDRLCPPAWAAAWMPEVDTGEAATVAATAAARLEITFDRKKHFAPGGPGLIAKASVFVKNTGDAPAENLLVAIKSLSPADQSGPPSWKEWSDFGGMLLHQERHGGEPLIPGREVQFKVAEYEYGGQMLAFYISAADEKSNGPDDRFRFAWPWDWELVLEAAADGAASVTKAFAVTVKDGVMDFKAKPIRTKQ